MMKKLVLGLTAALAFSAAHAADYKIDTKGAHASINFKIQHLGYSWLVGRFNQFEGSFTYNEDDLSASDISVTIDTTSVDTNHAERDKHLRGDDFLNVDKYPEAKFVSTGVESTGDDTMNVMGNFTLHGVTKPITIEAKKIGEGKDPWGGYRAGFSGTTKLALKDFGIDYDLGPASQHVMLTLHIEGVKQ